MTASTVHHDRGPLGSAKRLSDGGIEVQGIAARTHAPDDPLRYPTGEEYRDANGLAELARSIVGTPITIGHTAARGDYAANAAASRAASCGTVTAARIDGDRLVVTMRLDARAAATIASGKRELSVGYFSRTDADGYQRNLKPFELAIVTKARCGSTCAILDAAEREKISGAPVSRATSEKNSCSCNAPRIALDQLDREIAERRRIRIGHAINKALGLRTTPTQSPWEAQRAREDILRQRMAERLLAGDDEENK